MHLSVLFVLMSVAGSVGYYLGATRDASLSELAADALVPLEYLVSDESFSEVERAGAVLDALASRYSQQARQLMAQEFMRRRATSWERYPIPSELTAITLLEEAMVDFRGTRQELTLLSPLLYGLKHEGLFNRWLDLYLDALYRHPTADIIYELMDQAVEVGRAADREAEVSAAVLWTVRLPVNQQPHTRIRQVARLSGDSDEPVAQ